MFDQLKQLGAMMKNAGVIKQNMEKFKAEMATRTFDGEAGGGAVRVTVNGQGRIARLSLDEKLLMGLAGPNKMMVEDLIAAAVNSAVDKMQAVMAEGMRKVTDGMDLPGMDGLLGP
jgi:DNA-binding YbaB/EbfC family protein